MDFAPTSRAAEFIARMQAFMRDHVFPAEDGYRDELVGGADWRRWKQPARTSRSSSAASRCA